MKKSTLILIIVFLNNISFPGIDNKRDTMFLEVVVFCNPEDSNKNVTHFENKRMLIITFEVTSYMDCFNEDLKSIELFQNDYLKKMTITNVDSVIIFLPDGYIDFSNVLINLKEVHFIGIATSGFIEINEPKNDIKNQSLHTFCLSSYKKSKINLKYLDKIGVKSVILDGTLPKIHGQSENINYLELDNPSLCEIIKYRKRMKNLFSFNLKSNSFEIPKYSSFGRKEVDEWGPYRGRISD